MNKNIKRVLALGACCLTMAFGVACSSGKTTADKNQSDAPITSTSQSGVPITSKWSFESVTTASGTSERVDPDDKNEPEFSTEDGVNFYLKLTKSYTGTITDNGDGTYTLTNPDKPSKPISAKIEDNVLTIIVSDTSSLTFVAK